jgi:hypothetical protein
MTNIDCMKKYYWLLIALPLMIVACDPCETALIANYVCEEEVATSYADFELNTDHFRYGFQVQYLSDTGWVFTNDLTSIPLPQNKSSMQYVIQTYLNTKENQMKEHVNSFLRVDTIQVNYQFQSESLAYETDCDDHESYCDVPGYINENIVNSTFVEDSIQVNFSLNTANENLHNGNQNELFISFISPACEHP